MNGFLADERRNKLAQMINDRGSIRIGDIADHFGVTKETIRKDLIYLDQKKLICKTHGGAVSLSESSERPIQMRTTENADKKERIAQKALEYLEGVRVLLLDSGSTILMVAKQLPIYEPITVVTNSFSVAMVLAEKEMSFNLVGGEFSPITMATSGMVATQTLNLIKADLVLLGSSGFQSSSGPSAKAFCDAQIKQDMIRNSRTKIVLADSSKFVTNAFVQFATWTDIDLLITDRDAPIEMLKELRKKVDIELV